MSMGTVERVVTMAAVASVPVLLLGIVASLIGWKRAAVVAISYPLVLLSQQFTARMFGVSVSDIFDYYVSLPVFILSFLVLFWYNRIEAI